MKTEKICSRCKILKPACEFYFFRPKKKKPSLSSACKACDIYRVKNDYSAEDLKKRHFNFRKNNWEKHCQALLKRRILLRIEALKKYGGENPVCHCCGEEKYEFLILDHMNDDGNQQRKQSGGGSTSLYNWLKKNNWPEGLKVSCHNCNLAREFYGICPHNVKDYKNVTSVESAIARRNPKRKRSCPSDN